MLRLNGLSYAQCLAYQAAQSRGHAQAAIKRARLYHSTQAKSDAVRAARRSLHDALDYLRQAREAAR